MQSQIVFQSSSMLFGIVGCPISLQLGLGKKETFPYLAQSWVLPRVLVELQAGDFLHFTCDLRNLLAHVHVTFSLTTKDSSRGT